MKLLTVGKDISELIEQIKWSGDTKQVARTIQFTIAKNKKDKDFPTVVIDEGAEIIMQDDSGKDVFGGIIFDIDKSASSKVETYLALQPIRTMASQVLIWSALIYREC